MTWAFLSSYTQASLQRGDVGSRLELICWGGEELKLDKEQSCRGSGSLEGWDARRLGDDRDPQYQEVPWLFSGRIVPLPRARGNAWRSLYIGVPDH